MRYSHILSYAMGRPWALHPDKLTAITAFLALKAAGGDVDPETVQAMAEAARPTSPRSSGAVAVIPLYGVLTQRGGMNAQTSEPLTSTMGFSAMLQRAATDPSVKAVVIDVDSPGGEVFGTEEAANVLASLVQTSGKPIVAVASSMAASAAYWIASQAEELVVTPSGEVGSIGVRAMHVDMSAQLEADGVKATFVTAGKYKVEGNSYEPLSDEARAELQRSVDEYYGAFVSAVARGRGVSAATVRSGYGEGRMLSAKRALQAGMVDRIDTLDGTIQRLASGGYRKPRRGMGAEGEFLHSLIDAATLEPDGYAVAEPEPVVAVNDTDTRRRRFRLHAG